MQKQALVVSFVAVVGAIQRTIVGLLIISTTPRRIAAASWAFVLLGLYSLLFYRFNVCKKNEF